MDLQTQIEQLKATARAAAGNPFLPAAASDAIEQACGLIETLASQVHDLNQLVAHQLDARG